MARRPKLQPVKTTKGWMLSIPGILSPTGKRIREYFGEAESMAKARAKEVRSRYHKGDRTSMLQPHEAMQAVEAIKLLAPHGISLIEAATLTVERLNAAQRRETFADCYRDAYKIGETHWRERYAKDMAKVPQWVGKKVMGMRVCDITAEILRQELAAHGAKSASTLKARLARVNPILSGGSSRKRSQSIEIMTDKEIKAMFAACANVKETRAVALLLYAGIRPDAEDGEITRLDWSSVGAAEIYVPHNVAKTGTDRHIPIQPVLAQYLKGAPATGPVRPPNWKRNWTRLRAAAGVSKKADVARHTFASHYLAAFGEDQAKQAMGHTQGSDTLFRHYRRAVTTGKGRLYFGLDEEGEGS